MPQSLGPSWGPSPLPEFLTSQLAAHGFSPGDAPKCAADLRDVPGRAATASLFVDLGSCKFLEGDIDGAVAAWRQAITSNHDAAAARALLNMGLMYEHLHLYPRAITVLASVADRAVAPYEVSAALALARCHLEADEVDTATETVARLAASTMSDRPHAPELAEILLALGDLAHDADRPDRAERSWRLAVAGPDSAARRVAASKLLRLSLEQGRDDEFIELLAIDDAEQSIASVVLGRADGLARLGHDDRANELLATLDEQALTGSERFRLADFRVHLGQVNEGIDQLEVLLGSPVPEVWQRAAFTLGTLYLDYEMPDVAAEMFDRVRTHRDRYWAGKAALVRGDLLALAGDHERAAVLWAEASESEVAEVRAVARHRRSAGLSTESYPAGDAREHPDLGADVTGGDTTGALIAAAAPVDHSEHRDIESHDVESHDIEVVDLGVLEAAEAEGRVEPEVVDLGVLEAAEAEGRVEPVASADARANLVVLADPVQVDASARSAHSVPSLLAPTPVVVELEPLGLAGFDAEVTSASAPHPASEPRASVFARLSDLDQPVELADEIGNYSDRGLSDNDDDVAPDNPYAALAPEGYEPPPVSASNPYAALAPNPDDANFTPAEGVKPGDWQSMLEDWPETPQPETSRGLLRKRTSAKRSSAFSRYT